MSIDKELSLYEGKYSITFTGGKRHKYYVNGMPVQGSVTTILNEVLAKNALMLWPLNKAMEHLNEIIKYKVVEVEDLDTAKNRHNVLRAEGSATGTAVHTLVEQVLLGNKIDLLDQPEDVIKAVEGFEEWMGKVLPDVVEVERIVYAEGESKDGDEPVENDYIGTLDSILDIDGKRYLCDLKTTNPSPDAPKGVYAENFIQLGAYAKAYLAESKEHHLDDLMVISCKKNGKVDVVKCSDLGLTISDCIKLWDSVHHLYFSLKSIKSKLKEK